MSPGNLLEIIPADLLDNLVGDAWSYLCRVSIRWCVCMLQGKCGTGARMWMAL